MIVYIIYMYGHRQRERERERELILDLFSKAMLSNSCIHSNVGGIIRIRDLY